MRKAHTPHAGKRSEAGEAEYLAYVKDWQVYGSSFFFVEPQVRGHQAWCMLITDHLFSFVAHSHTVYTHDFSHSSAIHCRR